MSSSSILDPQPGEFWATSKGRTVEIVARDVVAGRDPAAPWDVDGVEADTVAYRFLGGSLIHLRSVGSLRGWVRVFFE